MRERIGVPKRFQPVDEAPSFASMDSATAPTTGRSGRASRIIAAVTVALLGAVVATILWPDAGDAVNEAAVAAPGTPPVLDEPPARLGRAQELRDIDAWLQSDITSLDELAGQVHVVQFWTFGCYNCKNTIPFLQQLDATYGDRITIVGVHSPEFDFESDIENIVEAADQLGVTWPIAVDNNQTNFFGWQGRTGYWPRLYVIDQDGEIRLDRRGEGGYGDIEATVAYLLTEQA